VDSTVINTIPFLSLEDRDVREIIITLQLLGVQTNKIYFYIQSEVPPN